MDRQSPRAVEIRQPTSPTRKTDLGARALRVERYDHWQDLAACADEDPELFFPIGSTGPAKMQAEEAKLVCRRCPVIDQCLQFALENNEDFGVWGGTSEAERRAYGRRQTRAKRASQ